MKIHILPSGPISTNAYLLTESALNQAILIDAPGDIYAEIEPILATENCRLAELWITHGHWDHTQDAADIIRQTAVPVIRAHEADQAMFEHPEIMSPYLDDSIHLKPFQVTHWMNQSDRFTALNQPVEIRHVPGHCPGNILFHLPDTRHAFVGDAIFNGSVGRTDLPGGSMSQLEESIRTQIYTLPDSTQLFPGHGPVTTVSDEKNHNPYVRG